MSSSSIALTDNAVRPSLLRLTRVEGRKMVDTRAGFWLLLLTALAAIGGVVGERLGFGDEAAIGQMFLTSCATASLLLPVVGVMLVTSEWSQRTGLITFTLVPARGRIVAAKVIATLALAATATAICLLLAAIGAATSTGPGLESGDLARGLIYQGIAVSIGVGLGLAIMNTPGAIVVLFVGPLLVAAIGAISASINDVTTWLDQSVLQELVETGGAPFDDWGKVAVTLAVWAVIPLAIGMLRLRRGDID